MRLSVAPPTGGPETFPAGKVSAAPDRAGFAVQPVALDRIRMFKLVRDRKKVPDFELSELKSSIAELGLSNPIRVESRPDGDFELIQGYRRLSAYRELLKDTGDVAAYGAIPATVTPPGADLDALYRRMVDENLVRKDISFAEMAMLALDFASDPGTSEDDPEKAVAVLYKSASYQKRSYIRSFMTIVRRLDKALLYPQEIPRSLGLTLARRLEEVEGLAMAIRAELADWDNRSIADELDVLRRLCGAVEDGAGAAVRPAPRPSRAAAGTKTSFTFDRRHERCLCIAATGKLEIRLDRDFTAIDRTRLEQALRLMLDQVAP